VESAVERGLIVPDDLYLSRQRTGPTRNTMTQARDELLGLARVAEVLRGPSSYLAPETLVRGVKDLLDGSRVELLDRDRQPRHLVPPKDHNS
jgi:hypothetical protein